MNRENTEKICLICGEDCYDYEQQKFEAHPVTMHQKHNYVNGELVAIEEPLLFTCNTCAKKIKDNLLSDNYVDFIQYTIDNMDNNQNGYIDFEFEDVRPAYLFYKYQFLLLWLNSSTIAMQEHVQQWLFDNSNFQTPVVRMPGHYGAVSVPENTYKLEVYAYHKTASQNFFTKYENLKKDEKGAYCFCNFATIPVYAQLGPNVANGPIFDFDEIRQANGYGRLCLRILDVEQFDEFAHYYESFLYEYIHHKPNPNIETKKDDISSLKKVFSTILKVFRVGSAISNGIDRFVKGESLFDILLHRTPQRVHKGYKANYTYSVACKKCGSEVSNEFAYCEYCGTQN